jgi:NTP pyrophosphatase (non-canonical NTP hydrolase)
MEIKEAQKRVEEHIKKMGYTKIETNHCLAFLHLVEEVGETARSLLHQETNRGEISNTTIPKGLKEEVADIFWQVLKLCYYLGIDLEEEFLEKHRKNMERYKEIYKKT